MVLAILFIVLLTILGLYCSPVPQTETESFDSDSWDSISKHYVNYDDLMFSKELNPEPGTEPVIQTIVKRSLVQLPDKLELNPVPLITQFEDENDMEVAESHLFRPVFRYKSQYAERRRVRQVPSQFAALVVQ
ncbi:uncharacterized protein LOC131691848 [Topomyia yanbarensis]|uniref:uncharacterized protein LOC131691848 n=1 Tax=Topomyia yanbarensis TaxID=2498891 RepID=UPI00273B2FAB|nr:uncharacterized protein LOC131691848 [Topomyia yanbarensis]